MNLRKIKSLRPGTARYSINGVAGIDDDDRAVVSVWPHPSGAGLVVMVTIDGSINVRDTIHLPIVGKPAAIDLAILRRAVVMVLTNGKVRRNAATRVDNRPQLGVQ